MVQSKLWFDAAVTALLLFFFTAARRVQPSSSVWKELQIEDGCVWHKNIQSVVTNNRFNWICERNDSTGVACLFSFHLYKEKFGGDLDDVEIWVMKDWNSMEWAKEHVILAQSLWSFVPNVSAFDYLPMQISPLGFTADGRKLLLRLDGYGKLISYDLDSQS
ncbi:hypothetical protein AKJ16_DCAP06797 [Drosera capensis]